MEQGEHGLVNRLVSHIRMYFLYLLAMKKGIRFQVCIFTVTSDMCMSEQRTVWHSVPDSHFAMYSITYEIRKRFGVCFL